MKNEEAIAFLEQYIDPEVYTEKCISAHAMGISALKQNRLINAEKMEPLTPEQLREMDGKPVWVTPTGFWALVIAKKEKRVELICNDGETVYADKYIELVGPVYAYPPSHIDREAWTAEWIEQKTERGTVQYICSKCFDYHEFRSDAVNSYIVRGDFLFCRKCGRAMTPGAWDELEKRLRG